MIIAARIARVGLSGVLVYKGRSARPWVFLGLLAAVGMAIAAIVVGIHRGNTIVEEYLALYVAVGLVVVAAPVVLLWGAVASFRRRTAEWQTLAGGVLSFLLTFITWVTYAGD